MAFADFELDPLLLQLRRRGRPIAINPTPMRLLLYLVEHRHRLISKQELLREVWPSVVVSDTALATALKEIRRALGDDGASQRWIQTQRRRGFRFVGEVTTRIGDASRTAAPAERGTNRRMWGTCRGPSLCFVGREGELRHATALLLEPSLLAPRVAVEGLAGVGKTELALQLAHSLAATDTFTGGIYWLDAENPDLAPIWGTVIADQSRLPKGPTEERAAEIVRRIDDSGQPTLVILDNVTSWASTSRPRPLPTGPHVRVLATTRTRYLGGAHFWHIALDTIQPPHDRTLLLVLAGRDPEPGVESLLRHLGGHTLALELAGAFLGTYPSETAGSYLAQLLVPGNRVEKSMTERVGYEQTTADAFRAVWDRLGETARAAWWLASFLDAQPVTPPVSKHLGATQEVLEHLADMHLIQRAEGGSWTMHRLAKRFAQACPPPPQQALPLLLQLGSALLHRVHLTSEMRRVFSTALERTDPDGSSEEVFLALEGLWFTTGFRGEWSQCAELARSIDLLASAADSHGPRLAADAALGATHLMTGRPMESTARFRTALAAATLTKSPRTLLPTRAFVLCHGAHAECFIGLPDEGLRWVEESRRLQNDDIDPSTRAMIILMEAALLFYRREEARIPDLSEELVRLDRLYDLPFPRYFGGILTARYEAIDAPSGAKRSFESMWQLIDEMDAHEIRIATTLALAWIADLGLRHPHLPDGGRAIEAALEIARSGERYIEPELMRLRAAFCEEPSERIHWLEAAVRAASLQGARWWELRTTADLLEAAVGSDTEERWRRHLHLVYDGFTEGLELPDLRRVAALLSRGPVPDPVPAHYPTHYSASPVGPVAPYEFREEAPRARAGPRSAP